MPDVRGSSAAAHRGRLSAVLLVNLAILLVETIGGVLSNSLALLTDAEFAAQKAKLLAES
jgi:cobalt-zinc-cadmium efflux system protein